MRTIASAASSPAATISTFPSGSPVTPMIPGAVPRATWSSEDLQQGARHAPRFKRGGRTVHAVSSFFPEDHSGLTRPTPIVCQGARCVGTASSTMTRRRSGAVERDRAPESTCSRSASPARSRCRPLHIRAPMRTRPAATRAAPSATCETAFRCGHGSTPDRQTLPMTMSARCTIESPPVSVARSRARASLLVFTLTKP